MFIIQLEPTEPINTFEFLRQFFKGKYANFMINGFINIGNNQNTTYSEFLECIAKFILQINNIQISKTNKGMLVEFNNYNLFLSEISKDNNIQISMRVDYLPNIHAIISNNEIEFKCLGFGERLSKLIGKSLLQTYLNILFETLRFIIDIRPHLHQLIPIATSFIKMASQKNSNITINDHEYLVSTDHSVCTISKTKSKRITHIYSVSIKNESYTIDFGIFKEKQYIIGIKFQDIHNNWCQLYINENA